MLGWPARPCGVAVILALAAVWLFNVGGPAGAPSSRPPVTVTRNVPPSVLLTVMNGPVSGPGLPGLVAATARPSEDIAILQAGRPAKTVVAADSPAPPKVVIPGQPVAPGGGETSYQRARYAKRLTHWRGWLAAARQADAMLTRGTVSAWLRGLGIQGKVSKLADARDGAGRLAAESAAAASALAGLELQNGNIFGRRRVIVLYCDDLSGTLPAESWPGTTLSSSPPSCRPRPPPAPPRPNCWAPVRPRLPSQDRKLPPRRSPRSSRPTSARM